MGMPMRATPNRHRAVSRQVARRFRAWAAKKLSRSAGPGTGFQALSGVLLYLRVLALHHRHPLPVGPLHFHLERVFLGGYLFDGDPGLDLLAAHHAFIV